MVGWMDFAPNRLRPAVMKIRWFVAFIVVCASQVVVSWSQVWRAAAAADGADLRGVLTAI
jgi:hypothetical protein